MYIFNRITVNPQLPKRINKLAEIANKENADAICHGCTGKGNDQVRFELGIKAVNPDIDVLVPWRYWELNSREKEIDYAEKHKIPLKIKRETNYSKDRNVWHLSHEGLDLEDPKNMPDYEKILEMGKTPMNAKDKEEKISLYFEKGLPVALNGEKMSLLDIIEKLNKIGGKNGIGIIDIVENRLVGMKSRGVYETPGGTIIYKAHEILESICLDKDTMHFKSHISSIFGELLYDAKWDTLLRESLSCFVNKTQELVTGEVKLILYKGNIIKQSVSSKYSMHSKSLASFGEDNYYNQKDSEGFTNLYSLETKVRANMLKKNNLK